jgi:FtsZ-binding cell division protein ZapB
MPTENRSSNTEQMVPAAPGALAESIADVEAWLADDSDPGSISITQRESIDLVLYELKRLRLPSIEQHQGEPVGYRWNNLGMGWRYGETLPAIIIGTWQELYTHPDAGEVERLRTLAADLAGGEVADLEETRQANAQLTGELQSAEQEVERLRAELESVKSSRDAFAQNAIDLRAQLAERDALLRDINKRHSSGVDFDLPADLAARVAAVCATSAEPKSCGACAGCTNVCQLDKDSPPSAQVERDELVPAALMLRQAGFGNLADAVDEARAALDRKS